MFRHLTANPRRVIAAAASGLLLAAPLVVATTPTATAAGPSPVTIKVDLGSQFLRYAASFQVSGVTPGAGPEMKGTDSERTSSYPNFPIPGLEVDLDPVAQTITIEPNGNPLPSSVSRGYYPLPVQSISLDLAGADLGTLAAVSDNLFSEFCISCGRGAQLASAPRVGAPGDPTNTNVTRTIAGGSGHWLTTWSTSSPSILTGAAVFKYTLPAPPAPQVSPAKSFSFGTVGKPTGKPEVGNKLTAPELNLPAGATETFQWYRVTNVGGHSRIKMRAIRGAHGKKYKLRQKDKGSKVFVRMRLSAPGYTPATVDSRRKRIR